MEDNKWFGMDGFNRNAACCSYKEKVPRVDLKPGVVTINNNGMTTISSSNTIVISAGSVEFEDGTNLEDFKEAVCGSGNGGYKESSIGNLRAELLTLNFRRI